MRKSYKYQVVRRDNVSKALRDEELLDFQLRSLLASLGSAGTSCDIEKVTFDDMIGKKMDVHRARKEGKLISQEIIAADGNIYIQDGWGIQNTQQNQNGVVVEKMRIMFNIPSFVAIGEWRHENGLLVHWNKILVRPCCSFDIDGTIRPLLAMAHLQIQAENVQDFVTKTA